MKFVVCVLCICISSWCFACSTSESMGFCQNIRNDTSIILLGIKVNDYLIYNDTLTFDINTAGMSFKVLESIRGIVNYDTITIWSEQFNMCTWGTYELQSGDTFLLKLLPTNISFDSLENHADYLFPNNEWPFTHSLNFTNDTLRGLVYQEYRDNALPIYPPYHPSTAYQIYNVAYSAFKANIQSGLICFDYTSIEEKSIIGLKIYPIPVNKTLYIDINKHEDYIISIYSVQGKLMRQFVNNLKEIDLSELIPGIYILTVELKGQTSNIKLLIN